MPKKEKRVKVDDLRHAEYYSMQETFDILYAKSKDGEIFDNIMRIILLKENILLAYRNIKTNTGSHTPGSDQQTIKEIGQLTPDEVVDKVRYILTGSPHGYRPKPVRRKEIPKPNGTTRPLGIPCIWDRLIQQCIKQVLEPICEAKFSDNSYGFRPGKSAEQAIQRSYTLMQRSHMYYVIEFDIKGFFDNVNHSKLMRQLWSLGIRDKTLLYVIKKILKAPIKMPDKTIIFPQKGTPQGGILSPLLANVVLNELDHWIDSQWQEHPISQKYAVNMQHRGKGIIRSEGYKRMRKTRLKEMYIVRYADDFRIYCRTKAEAEKIKSAVTQWLMERLKLELSEEKTRIVNMRKQYSQFLGFKMRVQKKGQNYTVKSHICDKALKKQIQNLKEQVKNIASPQNRKTEKEEVVLYNSMVMGLQNYYKIATEVSLDCRKMQYAVTVTMKQRLKKRLKTTGRTLTDVEKKRYGPSKMLRYMAATKEPIYPVGYVQHKPPMAVKRTSCFYTEEGRKGLHDNLEIDMRLILEMTKQAKYKCSIEYTDNRISLYSAQYGKCFVTGIAFQTTEEIHCHHKKPKSQGGTDQYSNLVLVLEKVHILIHARQQKTIKKYLSMLNLETAQIKKLNELRKMFGNFEI